VRLHGRNGVAYVSPTNGVAASPCAFLSDWSISMTVKKVDVTALGDSNLVYVSGLPDASGDFTGFYDDATSQTFIAATDGLARNFYLYPSTLTATQYFFGTILPDFSTGGGVGGAVTMKSTWNAASAVTRVTSRGIGT